MAYASFRDFYPFYLSQHVDDTCRRLHVIGTGTVLAILLIAILGHEPLLLVLMPIAGYGFAWVGHFFFEHNRPATFTYPVYSLLGDFVLFFEVVSGRRRF